MSAGREDLLREALRLSPDQRADLAVELIESLDSRADNDVDMAWAVEIARRASSAAPGSMTHADWNEVRQRIEREILGR